MLIARELPIIYKPGDLIFTQAMYFEIRGIHLGALGQTDALTIIPRSQSAPTAHGASIEELVVPTCWLDALILGGLAKWYRSA